MYIYSLLCPFTSPTIKSNVIPVHPQTDDSPCTIYLDTHYNIRPVFFTTTFLMIGFHVHVRDNLLNYIFAAVHLVGFTW